MLFCCILTLFDLLVTWVAKWVCTLSTCFLMIQKMPSTYQNNFAVTIPDYWTSTRTTRRRRTATSPWTPPSAAAWTSSTSVPGSTMPSRISSTTRARSCRRRCRSGCTRPRPWWGSGLVWACRHVSAAREDIAVSGCSRQRRGGCPPCSSCSSVAECAGATSRSRRWPDLVRPFWVVKYLLVL